MNSKKKEARDGRLKTFWQFLAGKVRHLGKYWSHMLLLIVPLIFWAPIGASFWNEVVSPKNQPSALPKRITDLRVYDESMTQYAEWERAEVIKYGFEHFDSTVNYLFVAAVAILAFFGKIIMNLPNEERLPRRVNAYMAIVAFHAALGCLLSFAFGFIAHSYLVSIPIQVNFTEFSELGTSVALQVGSLSFAGGWTIVAVIWTAYRRIKS